MKTTKNHKSNPKERFKTVKFLVVEESSEDRSVFYNFAIITAEDEDEAEKEYLQNIDIDSSKTDLIIMNIDEIDENYYHFLEIDLDKIR